jgi:hypothetical protein
MELKEINKIFIEGEIRNKVTDAGIKDFLFAAINDFPDYFWTAPASRSKYHYPDERQEGGLVLHVRRMCKLTEDIVRMYELTLWEKDVLIAACILHDSFSRGIPPNVKNASDPLHPFYPEMMFPYNAYADRFIKDQRIYDEIMTCVASHMGRFSVVKSVVSNKKLPAMFHMIDYIASRTYVKIEI